MLIEKSNKDAFQALLSKLEKTNEIVVDLETTGLYPYEGDRLIGIALYLPDSDTTYYLSYRHSETDNLDLKTLGDLYNVLSNPNKRYYGWNVKFDAHFLLVDGFPILKNGAIYRDVMIALHLLDENRYDLADKRGLNYKLKDNARLYLGADSALDDAELDKLLKSKGYGKGDLWKLAASDVSAYAESDVKLTWQLLQFFMPFLVEWDQLSLFEEMCEYSSGILLRMEHTGVPVDRELIKQHIRENNDLAKEKIRLLKDQYGETFNPNSPFQVKEVLKTRDGRRTTLERQGTAEAQEIIDFKYFQKANNTFYQPYLDCSRLDDRIHPSFNTTRTNSGRLSSSNPNLQQVPRYSERYRVKEVFIAPNGYKIVQFDYSQQELRLACNFSGQENMTEEYMKQDADVHSLTTSILFGITYEEAKHDKVKRNIGKVTNFGFSYGMGVMKAAIYIASSLKKTLLVDKKFYTEYHSYLPKIGEDETRISYEDFLDYLNKAYAGTREVEDARIIDEEFETSIWETTKILFNWKNLYSNFVDSLKSYATLANTFRTPNGDYTEQKQGYKYIRLTDNRVRHYIKGQRPFTAWNFLIQGTGASIMRQSLMRIHNVYGLDLENSGDVIPIISVHDSVICLIKYGDHFNDDVRLIKTLMENYPAYTPPMKVDIEFGDDWGHLEKWNDSI